MNIHYCREVILNSGMICVKFLQCRCFMYWRCFMAEANSMQKSCDFSNYMRVKLATMVVERLRNVKEMSK